MEKILIADDDKNISKAISIYLKGEGYDTQVVENGLEAVDALKKEDFDLVLLDIMMPVMDGIEAMERIRDFSAVPIILITAKSEDADKVLGLNVGADDYITKPFNPIELIARVKSQLRRNSWMKQRLAATQEEAEDDMLEIGEIAINYATKTVLKNGIEISVTPREYDILKFLMENANHVYSPKEIYLAIWQDDLVNENAVSVHIRHLREKLEIDPASPRYIKVNWGRGYLFEAHNN